MAGTRVEKLGSIFSRVTSLLKCKAIKPEDKPLWYDVYQAFPPIHEPSFARRIPNKEIKEILFPEDRIRAKFHQGAYRTMYATESLENEETNDITTEVINLTHATMKHENINEEEALKQVIQRIIKKKQLRKKGSMFKPKTRIPKFINEIDLFSKEDEEPPKLDEEKKEASDIKRIAEKNVDVHNILKGMMEKNVQSRSTKVVDDFKDALKQKKRDDSEK